MDNWDFRAALAALELTLHHVRKKMLLISLVGVLLGFPPASGRAFQSGSQIVNGDFESGGGVGWSESSLLSLPLVLHSSGLPADVDPRAGSYAAWLGGEINETASLFQTVTISDQSSVLGYWHWIDSSDTCGFDHARVLVDDTPIHSYTLCMISATGGWVKKTVDLSPYIGQTMVLSIQIQSDEYFLSSLFLDDVALEPGPPISHQVYLPLILNP
ncbi:MAG: hypothetical protein A2Z16_12830 [Chloroflexi bacterium RBG_16_54_18]|nr:MAG: hypothetical protein A2Z16_12830 [Chloroflexi bacterium RBG_16_54_18]